MAGMESNSPSLLVTQDKDSGTSHPANGLGRREFLRVTGITAFGLGFNLHRCLAEAASGSAVPGEDIIVGLEIGTSKVCAAVAQRLPDGTIKLLGIGQVPSRGVGRYRILDLEAVSACVRTALLDAEAKSVVKIRSVALALAGIKITPYPSGPALKRIFEWEKICYADRGDGVLCGISMAECKRARDLRVVAGANSRIYNFIRCLKDIGVEVERIIFAPVASAEAVLSANQKKLGALVIDMGEGTTDYAVYDGGVLALSDSLPVGGKNIANDLSIGLRIPLACAEKVAIKEGGVKLGLSLPREYQRIVIESKPGFAGREIEREVLNTIVHHRVRQAFDVVKWRLVNTGVRLDSLRAGVRLTGGCSVISGICELAEDVFGIPACIARVKGISDPASILENPKYSCVIGLVKLS